MVKFDEIELAVDKSMLQFDHMYNVSVASIQPSLGTSQNMSHHTDVSAN